MTNIVTIETSDGVARIDDEKLLAYWQEAAEHLGEIEAAQERFKEIVEEFAKEAKLKKSTVSKYFKERHAVKTKQTKEIGNIFTKLDEVLS